MNKFGPLATSRITRIVDEILGLPDQPGGREALRRVADSDATNGEILMKVKNQIVAADVIQFGQSARVIQPEQVRTEVTTVPKLKHGMEIEEGMIELMDRIEGINGTAGADDRWSFDNYVARSINNLIEGINDRQEILLWAMMTGAVTYDAYGIQFSGNLWNVPSNLIVTPASTYNNAASTPITDILALKMVMQNTYGNIPNRLTTAQNVLNNIYATTEFQNRAALYLPTGISANTLAQAAKDPNFQLTVLTAILGGMAVVPYDKTTQIETATGSLTSTALLDPKSIVLDNSGNDNNPAWAYFANTPCPEARVARRIGGTIDAFPDGRTRGPLGYATIANPQMNPPGIILWAVKCGFPIRVMEGFSGVLKAVLP